jgi:hypothetical protein
VAVRMSLWGEDVRLMKRGCSKGAEDIASVRL